MKKARIVDSLEYLDDKLIEESINYKTKTNTNYLWFKRLALMSCCICALFFVVTNKDVPISEDLQEGMAFETMVELNDKLYSVVIDKNSEAYENYNLEKVITDELIGEELGSQEIIINNTEEETVKDNFKIYAYTKNPKTNYDWYPRIIVGDSKGNYYHALIASAFNANKQTLEEVFEAYGLSSANDIKTIKLKKDKWHNYREKEINDREFIKEFYNGLVNKTWGDNDFLQENVYQNTGIDEANIDKLYTKYADDSVYLIVELNNGLCLDLSFTSHNYVEVFHSLYIEVDDSWLELVSIFK